MTSVRNACLAAFLVCIAGLALMVSGCATKVEEKPSPPEQTVAQPPQGIQQRHVFGRKILLNILFAKGKSDLMPEGVAELENIVAAFNASEIDTLMVVGHASKEGSEEYNMALGLRRAEKVKAYLVERGIAAERITAKSVGESEQLHHVSPEEARDKLNRYVSFEVKVK